MAEVQTDSGGGKGKGGKVRSKKMSTRIDFTPMVDLGFLLITFFMLTTTLAKPQVMPLTMPEKTKDEEEATDVKESMVLNLLLGKDDKVYYFTGITDAKLDSTDFSAEGLRKVLLAKKDEVASRFPDKEVEKKDKEGNPILDDNGQQVKEKIPQLIVIIKPTNQSKYKNLVDAYDEIAICGIKNRVHQEISDAELEFIKNPAGGLKLSVEEQLEAAVKK